MTKFERDAVWAMEKLQADFGFSVEDAAAIMGNAGHESGGLELMQELKPTVKGSRGGYGWFQWTGPRRRAFEAYCARNNLDINSREANYAFLFVELKGDEKAAVAKTKAAKGLEAKVKAFELGFERAGVKHYPSRNEWARKALKAWNERKPEAPQKPVEAPVAPQAPTVAPVKENWLLSLLKAFRGMLK
jgi:hypothetical protein